MILKMKRMNISLLRKHDELIFLGLWSFFAELSSTVQKQLLVSKHGY